MKMRPEILQQLRSLLPEELHDKAFIAGGYAHNPELAEDIDLWVVGQEDMEATANVIRAHAGIPAIDDINDPGYAVNPHGFMVAYNTSIEVPDPGYVPGKVHVWFAKFITVQLLVTRQPDIDTLLSYFDITTHKIAYPLNAPGTFRVGEGYFPTGAQPRVSRWDSPAHTLRRLQKIAARYNHVPHPEDVEELVRLGAPRPYVFDNAA